MKISLLLTFVFVICLHLFQAAASSLLQKRRKRTVCELSGRSSGTNFSKNRSTIIGSADKDEPVFRANLQGLKNDFSGFRNKFSAECMETGSLRVSKCCFAFYHIPNLMLGFVVNKTTLNFLNVTKKRFRNHFNF